MIFDHRSYELAGQLALMTTATLPSSWPTTRQRMGDSLHVGGPDHGRGVSLGLDRRRHGARDVPVDAEQRMAEFTELAGTAIANAESRPSSRHPAPGWSRPRTRLAG